MVSISTNQYIDNVDLQSFASKRTTKKEILYSKRGAILDVTGDVLAENVFGANIVATQNRG